MDTSIPHTVESLENMLPIYPSFLVSIKIKEEANSSAGFALPSVPLGWRFFLNTLSDYRDSFIGMLEPGEADKMREELKLFKKRFNDSFARKNKILFGH